ncbi:MAG TPA: hypothetical protein VIY10_13535 [Solirubrobacteraceae bacterium]
MRRWLRLAALAGAVITVSAAATPAALGANTVGNAVLADCNSHGLLTHNYTLGQLRHALAIMPASFKEYGNCQDVIQAAIIKVRSGKPIVADSSGSGGSFLPTPVIVILVLLILAALTFFALAVRRRRMAPGGGPDDDDPPGDAPSPPAPPPPAVD